MIEIIIPTMLEDVKLKHLINQIKRTANYPYEILFTGTNSSASANRNIGLRQSKCPMVVMVDDDIEFPNISYGWLNNLVETLSRPDVVMVSAQLLNKDHTYAYMTGLQDCKLPPKVVGETIVPTKRILTACCAFKHYGLLFDENFVGSGFEDIDFCNQLAKKRPDDKFIICHSALAIHRNEAKNQRGDYWTYNEQYYNRKWNIKT